jgi:hypothetical protein
LNELAFWQSPATQQHHAVESFNQDNRNINSSACRKRETLTGDATIRYFDYLEDLGGFEGLLPNLFTEITTSKERSFACVDFVDTPGLVDGDMKVCFCATSMLSSSFSCIVHTYASQTYIIIVPGLPCCRTTIFLSQNISPDLCSVPTAAASAAVPFPRQGQHHVDG